MTDELKNIDKFYKNSLENYKEKAGRDVWGSMRWPLFWMRHKWRIGLSSIILLLGLSGFWISSNLFNNPESLTNLSTFDNSKLETILTTKYKAVESQNFDNNSFSTVKQENINDGELTNVEEVSDFESNQDIIEIESVTVDQVILITENFSNTAENEELTMEGINSKSITHNIAVKPDSSLLGYNRRNEIPTQTLRKQRFSVNVAVGPSFSQSDLSGYDSEYLAFRSSHESNKPGWSLGIDMRLHLKNWIIGSGLTYSVYNQSRSYKHSFEEYSPEDSYYDYDTTWTWFFDPPEIGIPIIAGIDSSWVDIYRNIDIDNSGTNQMKYFEIPLTIGYGYNANMFALEINAGISAGFLLYSDIRVPDLTNNVDIITAEKMNQVMFNFVANASFYYHINRQTSIYISPYYKRNMVSVFSKDYPVNQRIKTYGLNLGINFRF